MDKTINIPSLVELVANLPPFQKVMEQVMATLAKPYSSARELGRWIEADTAISGTVLSLANSSYYGQPQRISNASQAVVLLGRRALEETFFSIYIQGLFQSQGTPEVSQLWAHSLSCGLYARELVSVLGLPSAEGAETPDGGAYLAGLLHDAGKLLVLTNYPDAYTTARERRERSRLTWVDAEQHLWGFDHCMLGEAMARKWGLPESICEAVRWHHAPFQSKNALVLTALVHVGDLLSAQSAPDHDHGEGDLLALADPDALQALALDADSLPKIEAIKNIVNEKMDFYRQLLRPAS